MSDDKKESLLALTKRKIIEHHAEIAAQKVIGQMDRPSLSDDKTQAMKWPWGDYETNLLRHLAAAADRFWKNYDPTDKTTAPTNQQVIDWLKDRGVADRNAEIMAKILRADDVPPGPRR